LHDRLAVLGAQALVEVLANLDDIQPQEQPADGVSYANKISKEEALVDWRQSSIQLDRLVRAFNPWPVAETRLHGQQLRIWEAVPQSESHAKTPGTVLRVSPQGVEVAAGEGVLILKQVQLAGRKLVSAAEFARAHALQDAVLGT
jgi:methionyl-tRNA formyltransferase